MSDRGIFVVGAGGVIADADDGACRLVGYSRTELVGLHGSELVPREKQPATATAIDRMRRGELARAAGRLRRKDGTLIEVDVDARRSPDGRFSLDVRRSG